MEFCRLLFDVKVIYATQAQSSASEMLYAVQRSDANQLIDQRQCKAVKRDLIKSGAL